MIETDEYFQQLCSTSPALLMTVREQQRLEVVRLSCMRSRVLHLAILLESGAAGAEQVHTAIANEPAFVVKVGADFTAVDS